MRSASAFALLAAAACGGCVRRTVTIETDPPGANLVVDFSDIGPGPAAFSFEHYGTRRIEARLDGYETLRQDVSLRPPWYQWFPLELVSEFVIPWTIKDERTVKLTLAPAKGREETLLSRAEEARRFEWKKGK